MSKYVGFEETQITCQTASSCDLSGDFITQNKYSIYARNKATR